MEAGRQGSVFWSPDPAGSPTVPQAHGARAVGVREAKEMRGNAETAVAISNGPQDGHLLHSAGPPLSALRRPRRGGRSKQRSCMWTYLGFTALET